MPSLDAKDIANLIRARIAELKPLVDEHNELVEVERSLSQVISRRPPQRSVPRMTASPAKSPRAAAKTAGPATKRLLPTLENARRGLTATQLADKLGLKTPASVYKMLNEFRAQGRVRKEGMVWHAVAQVPTATATSDTVPGDPAGTPRVDAAAGMAPQDNATSSAPAPVAAAAEVAPATDGSLADPGTSPDTLTNEELTAATSVSAEADAPTDQTPAADQIPAAEEPSSATTVPAADRTSTTADTPPAKRPPAKRAPAKRAAAKPRKAAKTKKTAKAAPAESASAENPQDTSSVA